MKMTGNTKKRRYTCSSESPADGANPGFVSSQHLTCVSSYFLAVFIEIYTQLSKNAQKQKARLFFFQWRMMKLQKAQPLSTVSNRLIVL